MRLRDGHQHSQFWPILARFLDYYSLFCGPGVINPKVRLCVGHQHSQFRPILARFLDYYSLFWRPGVNFTIKEPRDAFTCRLSASQFWPTLAHVMDYYSLFWGPE